MRLFLPAFCLLSILTLPASADPAPAPPPRTSSLRPDILYTHKGEFVQVSPMRPLTLNAHVEQFQYDPQGLEIAYVGSEPSGEDTVHFVKTIDAHTGHEISRLTLTSPADGKNTNFYLLGFSPSGKYLLLQETLADADSPNTSRTEYVRWDLSAAPTVAQVINPRSSLPADAVIDNTDAESASASPDGRWVEFRQVYHTLDSEGKTDAVKEAYFLYDPERDTFKPLTLPPNTNVYSWSDKEHFRFRQEDGQKQFDVLTGQISPLPEDTQLNPPAASKQYPDLSLDTEQRDLDDLKDYGHAPSCIVWIRRTPFGKISLGSAAAGVMPSPQVNVTSENDPKAAWSPTGKQVAFIANGDLCVSNLAAATDLLPHEKMAVGLKLSCDEERQLAMSNLKQIGLALIQYTQDFDERFPPTKDIEQTIYPYLKTNDVFSVGSTRWVYHGVSNEALASVDDPANTVEATMDLPCAHIVLFMDGHVKAFPKQEAAP